MSNEDKIISNSVKNSIDDHELFSALFDYSENDNECWDYDEVDSPVSLFESLSSGEMKDVPLERNANTYHFRGDAFFTSFMRDIHDLKDGRYVNFYRLFSKTDSLFHDDDITDMIISNYSMTEVLKYILSLHPKTRITCAIEIPPSESPREPVNLSPYHTVIYPSFPSQKMLGLFHPSILMIRFSDRLRIVFSSAFIHVWDWEELTQWIWMQDFFIKPKQPTAVKKLDKEFRYDLIDFLISCQYPENRVFEILKDVCFENVSVRMVTSISGRLPPGEGERYGHLRLRTIIKDLNEYQEITNHPVTKAKPIIYQTNGIGHLQKGFIKELVSSSNGGMAIDGDVNEFIQIPYPSKAYVSDSIMYYKPENLCHYDKNYHEGVLLLTCLRPYVPTKGRERSLSRSHFLFTVPDEENRFTWVFGGSNNLSQFAWGRQIETRGSILFGMNNYELGLVLLPKNYVNYHNGVLKKGEWNEGILEDDYVKHVDLGFQLPLTRYTGDEIPFFYDDLGVSEEEEYDDDENNSDDDNDIDDNDIESFYVFYKGFLH